MTIFTRADLITSLYRHTGQRPSSAELSAELIADAIRAHDLDLVICGRQDGKAVNYARGFELVFGERLKL